VGNIVMHMFVCLFVCLCLLAYFKNHTAKLHQIFGRVFCGHGSVIFQGSILTTELTMEIGYLDKSAES